MFDFRYHALSLVAVIVALLLGLLLGVAIGDKGLVSSAESGLRNSLRHDLDKAQARAQSLQGQLAQRDSYEQATFGTLVADQLLGRHFDLLFVGGRSETVFQSVGKALAPSGGNLRFVSTLRSPLDLEALGRLATGTRYEAIAQNPALLGELGERLGRQLVNGGRLLRTLRGELLSSSSGELGPVDGVVLARTTDADKLTGEDAKREAAFVDGFVRGLRDAAAPVVGVEETQTTPSQVPWYQQHELSSVDDLDETAGMASLVFVLAGAADGHYGDKPTADALLPDALVRRPSQASAG